MYRLLCIGWWVLWPLFGLRGQTHDESSSINDSAVTIKSIIFHGNKRVSSAKLRAVLVSKEGQTYDRRWLDEDRMRALALYQKHLYFLTSIDSLFSIYTPDSTRVSLHFFITENKPVIIDTLVILGSSRFSSDRLTRRMVASPGRIFDPDQLAEDIEDLLTFYEDNGYPMARIACDRVEFLARNGQPRLRIGLTVHENTSVTVRKVEFAGLQQTRESVLLREMRLPLPSPYRQSLLDENVARLRRLTFIDRVDDPELIRYNDSSFALRLNVTEGQSNTVDGIVGYVPARSGTDEKGYFTGLMNLSFQNLLGTARRLEAKWQKKNRFSQEFLLSYTEPWVLNFPLNLSFSIQQLVQDTIYVERQFMCDGSVWLGSNWDGLFGGKSRTIDPAGQVNGFVYNIPTASFLSGYIGIQYDIRDDRVNPRRGVLYKASVEYGRKRESYFVRTADGTDTLNIPGGPVIVRELRDNVATQKWIMDFEWMFEGRRNLVFFNAIHAAFYKTPQAVVPYSEHYRFGGLRSVRGYVEDFFNGTRVAWNNLECRWLTGRRSRIFVFFDAGYYYRQEYADAQRTSIVRRHGWPMGYGFGLRYQTRVGLFGLDYGLGKNDGFSNGKVHFGITTQF